ncbi:hypothetical protein NE237_003319 [Protea cynaroides]|uniref:Uncharacterized protein n=1 Tax=Protea cynaroides TaxID=273540 RepID=A0A9Q0KGV4_9MAGN|nr:hypothetical protein NE237_003319 [Protea cynaroides]
MNLPKTSLGWRNQSHNLVTAGLFVLCSSSLPEAGVIGGDKGYGRGSGLLVIVPPRVGIEGVQTGRKSRMDSLSTSHVASPTVVTVSNMEGLVLDQSKAVNYRQVRFVDHPSQKDLDRVARCIAKEANDGSVRDPRVSSEPVRTSSGTIRVSNFVVPGDGDFESGFKFLTWIFYMWLLNFNYWFLGTLMLLLLKIYISENFMRSNRKCFIVDSIKKGVPVISIRFKIRGRRNYERSELTSSLKMQRTRSKWS